MTEIGFPLIVSRGVPPCGLALGVTALGGGNASQDRPTA